MFLVWLLLPEGDSRIADILIISFIILIALIGVWSTIAAWEELDNNLEVLNQVFLGFGDDLIFLNDVEYIDERLYLLIYVDYLISYSDFSHVNLRECSNVSINKSRRDPRYFAWIECVSTTGIKKSFKFRVVDEESVNSLFYFLSNTYDIEVKKTRFT